MASTLERRIAALEQARSRKSVHEMTDEELLVAIGLRPDATEEEIHAHLRSRGYHLPAAVREQSA